MSKQERDQDEQRASSGVGKDHAPADSATDKPATQPDSNRQTITDKPPVAKSDESDSGKAEAGKARAAEQNSEPGTQERPTKATKSTGGARGKRQTKASTEASSSKQGGTNRQQAQATPGGSQGSKPKDDKSPGKPKSSTAGNAKPASTAGATTPPSTPSSTAHAHDGGGGNNGNTGRTGLIAIVLFILLALAVLIGGWWGWQKLSAQQAQLAQIEDNAKTIAELESRLQRQFTERDQQREQTLQGMRDEMQRYQDDINRSLDRVLEDLAREQEADPSEWAYAEVEYLLRLANQRLQLERDVSGARALLRTADERVAQADNPALTAVRRAIQSELAELDSVTTVDRTGLYLALLAQQEQLAKLPLRQDIEQVAAEGGDTSPVEGAWREQLTRLGQELKELIVVRRHDQAFEALITPKQEAYLRQNIRLQLEQAQLAVLDANSQLLQTSLEKTTALIERYYDTEHEGVQASKQRLEALSAEQVRPELPDISGSLQALREFMKRRHSGGSADE